MNRFTLLGSFALLALVAGVRVLAQPPTPDPHTGAGADAESATARDPAADAEDSLPEGHQPVSEEALRRVLGGGPPLAEATPSDAVPAGAVDVLVIDERGAPVAGVAVRLGTMQAGQRQAPRVATTSPEGRARFDIPRGSGAGGGHRASIEYDGVKVGTPPFTLEPGRGVQVTLRKLATTADRHPLMIFRAQLVVEWKPERMHISQTLAITNRAEPIVALGASGLAVRLPRGFLAFEAQPSMTDQRLEATPEGFVVRGSIPPGTVQLQYTYDLPVQGNEARVRVPMPLPQTWTFQVVVDAASGMQLAVERFSESRRVEYQGRSLLVSEFERMPTDPQLDEVDIRIRDIPGRNPTRGFAIGFGVLLSLASLAAAARRSTGQGPTSNDEASRVALADAIVTLDEEHARGEIGDLYHRRERERLVDELAFALRHATSEAARNRTNAS